MEEIGEDIMRSAPHLIGGQTSIISVTRRVGAEASVEGPAQKPDASDLFLFQMRDLMDEAQVEVELLRKRVGDLSTELEAMKEEHQTETQQLRQDHESELEACKVGHQVELRKIQDELGIQTIAAMIRTGSPMSGARLDEGSDLYVFLTHRIHGSLRSHRRALGSEEFCEPPNLRIGCMEHVLDARLRQKYYAEKEHMAVLNPDGCTRVFDGIYATCLSVAGGKNFNELLLFHGCAVKDSYDICKYGFDPRQAKRSPMFGLATYMAEDSSKADRYAGPVSDWCCILVVAVLMGESIHAPVEHRGATKPKDRPDTGQPYDSVWTSRSSEGGCVDHPEFMVYKGSQLLPLFRVWYYHDLRTDELKIGERDREKNESSEINQTPEIADQGEKVDLTADEPIGKTAVNSGEIRRPEKASQDPRTERESLRSATKKALEDIERKGLKSAEGGSGSIQKLSPYGSRIAKEDTAVNSSVRES